MFCICMSADFCQRRIALPFDYYIYSISPLKYQCTTLTPLICIVLSSFSLLLLLLFKRMNVEMSNLFHVLAFCFVLKILFSFIRSQKECSSSDELLGESQHNIASYKMKKKRKKKWTEYFIMTKVLCHSKHNKSTWSWRCRHARFFPA